MKSFNQKRQGEPDRFGGVDDRTSDEVFRDISDLRLRYEQATDVEDTRRLKAELRALRERNAMRDDAGVSGLTIDQLRSAEHRLAGALDRLGRRRINPSMAGVGMGGGGGLDAKQIVENNQRVDRQGGRAALEKELLQISAELKRRSGLDQARGPNLISRILARMNPRR